MDKVIEYIRSNVLWKACSSIHRQSLYALQQEECSCSRLVNCWVMGSNWYLTDECSKREYLGLVRNCRQVFREYDAAYRDKKHLWDILYQYLHSGLCNEVRSSMSALSLNHLKVVHLAIEATRRHSAQKRSPNKRA